MSDVTGVSGNALVNSNADRLRSMNIWDYADGQRHYSNSMLVDLSQPPGQVGRRVYPNATRRCTFN